MYALINLREDIWPLDHLIKQGHKNIMRISANRAGGEFELWTEGFKAAFHDHNLQYNNKTIILWDTTFRIRLQGNKG